MAQRLILCVTEGILNMTEHEFNTKWSNYELEVEFSEYLAENYPDGDFDSFAESMITEEL